jgi:iron complex transport system substrate-binding protein
MAGAAALGLAAAARAPVRRVVSLNPCLDVILVKVAAPRQIAALSHYSRLPTGSSVGPEAFRFGVTWGTAEEVISLRPDLVLASRYTALATRNALSRLGVHVELFGTPESVAESLGQVRRIAGLVGAPDRGRAEVARIEAALSAAAPPPAARRPRALVYQRNGLASGPGTLMDEMLRRAGFHNAAVDYGATRTMDIPLEQVVADPPDLLLSGEPHPGAQSWGERTMRHPALARLAGRIHIVSFPEHLLYCGGPNLVAAAQHLAAARRALA